MRPYNQGNDFPTLLALIVAVGFPLLLLSLVFDLFPRDRIEKALSDLKLPFVATEARPSPSPIASRPPIAHSTDHDCCGRLGCLRWSLLHPDERPASPVECDRLLGDELWRFGLLGRVPTPRRGRRVGFPISNRFTFRGFTVQIFQKAVFQGPEQGGEVNLLNLMDDLSAAGKDEFLKNERSTPLPLGLISTPLHAPEDIPAARLALLSEDPAIEKAYREAKDPVRQFGLPTSKVTDMGDYLVAIRCQRGVLQRWKKDVPWAKQGDVTVANVGQIAAEVGFFPAEALRPVLGTPPSR